MSEEKKQEDINLESYEAIKEIFKKFDKDNSGSIDYREIGQLAKELGIQINAEEVTKIF